MAATSKSQKISLLRRLIAVTHKHGEELLAELSKLRHLNARRRAEIKALVAKPRSGHPSAPHRFGIDYTSMAPAAVARTGATFVCRYLSYDPAKNLSRAEAQALARRGIDKVVVWETTADRARAGHAAGVADAKEALHQAVQCGMPHARPIYFAVDFAGKGQEVELYFDGVRSVLGLDRTGAYGSYVIIRHLFDTKRIAWGWQTYAWSNGHWEPRAQLQQYDNSNNAFDKDRAVVTDFGQWR